MFKALHPTRDEQIYITEYLQLRRDTPSLGQPRCSACEQRLDVRGDLDPKVRTRFKHQRDPGAPRCPIKSEGGTRYEILTEGIIDTEAAAALRRSFFANWTYHWHQFRRYVQGVDIKDFAAALKDIDDRRVWRYVGLQEHEVIIAMLATRDFKPVKKANGEMVRSRWVRFWFRSGVRSLQDFWNLGDPQKILIRAEYDLTARATVLSANKLQEFAVVNVESDYLQNEEYAKVHTFIRQVMSERFPGLIAPPGGV